VGTTSRLSRRFLLRGSAGVALAPPLMEATRPARAQPRGASPRRFVVVAVGNGTIPEHFWPTPPGGKPFPLETEPKDMYWSGPSLLETTDHTFGYILEPLAAHKANLLVLEGIDNCKGVGGHSWYASLLPAWDMANGSPGGPSIDQVLASKIGGTTKFPSLQFGVNVGDQGGDYGSLSWYGVGKRAPAENNPYAMFTRLFSDLRASGTPVDTRAIQALSAQRKSVLDVTGEQIRSLQTRVSTADRAKLENYLESLRALEKQLFHTSPDRAVACGPPEVPMGIDHKSAQQMPQTAKAQMDMMAMAMTCDLTRVMTLQISHEGSNITHPFLDVRQSHHADLGHCANKDLPRVQAMAKISRWHATQVQYLVEKLKAIPEGDGSVLDNSAVLWVNGLSKGNSHNNGNIPTLMAGSLGGAFKTGRYIRFKREGSNYPYPWGKSFGDLFFELLRAYGVEATSFGQPKYFHGGAPEIRA
jgi:hypothetical protein